jgi:hypothetical protein
MLVPTGNRGQDIAWFRASGPVGDDREYDCGDGRTSGDEHHQWRHCGPNWIKLGARREE